MPMQLLLTCLAGLLVASPASAVDKIRITSVKKTVEKHLVSEQKTSRGSILTSEKKAFYVFTLRRLTPAEQEVVTASWVLMKQGTDGVCKEAARDRSVVVLPLGQSVTVESTPVSLTEIADTRRGGITQSGELAGYGIRLLDDKGGIVAERIDPPALANKIDWDKKSAPPAR